VTSAEGALSVPVGEISRVDWKVAGPVVVVVPKAAVVALKVSVLIDLAWVIVGVVRCGLVRSAEWMVRVERPKREGTGPMEVAVMPPSGVIITGVGRR
jgi:hypothetical protein